MGVATAVAISAATSANIAAQQAAESAARAECIAYVPTYKHAGATLEQIHYYAYCAKKLYPEPHESDRTVIIMFKVALILIFIGAGAGAYLNRDDSDGPFIGALYGSVGMLFAEFILAIVVIVLYFIFLG